MLSQILRHTPAWVFVLFFILLVPGFLQSRQRTVSFGKAAIVPAVMIMFSLFSVLSAFGVSLTGSAAWLLGAFLAIPLNRLLDYPRGITYSAADRAFVIPGSWLPMTLMMIIFFTKYGIGIALARKPLLPTLPVFVGSVSLAYGVFSAIFIAGLLNMRRLHK